MKIFDASRSIVCQKTSFQIQQPPSKGLTEIQNNLLRSDDFYIGVAGIWEKTNKSIRLCQRQ
jgi:hypothetical protein